ncbi:hypothetical protein PCE1_002130 [Barthelona sp. PCE]
MEQESREIDGMVEAIIHEHKEEQIEEANSQTVLFFPKTQLTPVLRRKLACAEFSITDKILILLQSTDIDTFKVGIQHLMACQQVSDFNFSPFTHLIANKLMEYESDEKIFQACLFLLSSACSRMDVSIINGKMFSYDFQRFICTYYQKNIFSLQILNIIAFISTVGVVYGQISRLVFNFLDRYIDTDRVTALVVLRIMQNFFRFERVKITTCLEDKRYKNTFLQVMYSFFNMFFPLLSKPHIPTVSCILFFILETFDLQSYQFLKGKNFVNDILFCIQDLLNRVDMVVVRTIKFLVYILIEYRACDLIDFNQYKPTLLRILSLFVDPNKTNLPIENHKAYEELQIIYASLLKER